MKYYFTILFFILSSHHIFSQNYVADFALYDPNYENDGVWEEEVVALQAMFYTYGWSYKIIDHLDIHNGELGRGSDKNYKALIMPGGWALNREIVITSTGEDNIRNFINSGGNYVGFCAGSFYAANITDWAQTASGENGNYNIESDYQEYDYNLNLFDGFAKGPFGWTPWQDGDTASYQIANINNSNNVMSLIEMPDTTSFFYYGGPFFSNISTQPPNYEIWATAVAPEGILPNAKIGENQPTIIRYTFGSGNVILFSYHPEVLINSSVDNVELSQLIDETQMNWDVGNQTQEEINLHSWNIVHAALQIANNEQVIKVESLPILLSVKIFLEGAYNTVSNVMNIDNNNEIPFASPYIEDKRSVTTIPSDVVDWLLLELRESENEDSIISKSVFLHKDGNIISDDGVTKQIQLNIPKGDYYIVIKHRNHLSIMSSGKIHLDNDSTTGSDKFYRTAGVKEVN